MVKDDDSILVVEGKRARVEFAVRKNGSMPAKEFLDKVKTRDKTNRARLDVLFMRLAQRGKNDLSESVFSNLTKEIFEFKRHPYRVACFFMGNRCLLTHGFPKRRGPAFVAKEIKKATEIMAEHLEREQQAHA